MLTLAEPTTYEKHRLGRGKAALLYEIWLPILLFGSIGAITWAIRGTDGWGGIDGTIVPGMTWGLLWYYLCRRKGIDARGVSLWLGLGIALGGELGYGQYVSWIQGNFYMGVGDEIIHVAPWIGYVWFAIAGIGWGAPGGILLGWTLGGKGTFGRWAVRLVAPALAGYLAWLLVRGCPFLFFPNHSLGIYKGELDHHLERTVYTNTQNFVVLAWWIGAMIVAAFQRDRTTLVVGALIGGGFGIGFTLGALWCLGYTYAPGYIDWWKIWELNAGFNLGLLYAVTLYWAIRQVDKTQQENGLPPSPSEPVKKLRGLSLVASLFLLLYVMFRGASLRTGVLLELYDPKNINQYDWPLARTLVFAPMAAVAIGIALVGVWRILMSPRDFGVQTVKGTRLPERTIDLFTTIGLVGAITIWPSEIGVLYALFLCFATFALTRLNRHFDSVDAGEPD